jgi:hypothetical protein
LRGKQNLSWYAVVPARQDDFFPIERGKNNEYQLFRLQQLVFEQLHKFQQFVEYKQFIDNQ